jgi:inner membrane protein
MSPPPFPPSLADHPATASSTIRHMDSLTQAVLGATVYGAVMGRRQGRRALLYGAMLGTLPDLDVVISYPDPVSAMTYHRGFSHSLIVLSALSFLLAWLFAKFKPSPHYSGKRLLLAIWLTLVTHPLLDAFTTYGTQLLWPFMPTPTAWSTIFIVDPIYTVPLALATLLGLALGMRLWILRFVYGALAFSTAYLAFTVGAKLAVHEQAREALTSQGITYTALFSGTAPLNSLLWRVMAKDGTGHYYEGFIGLLDKRTPTFTRLPLNPELANALAGSSEHQRLRWFTGDWLRYDATGDSLVVTDLRMGMVGHHFFRFNMATRTENGWQPTVPTNWEGNRGGSRELGVLWHRVWNEDPPIPLEEWNGRMQDVRP